MDSVGEVLRQARELKNVSVEQVAQETNISRRYLESLEQEDFSQFPGETYLIGFLRNYADYLGLDPDKILDLYRNYKVREQPVPMDQLLGKPSRFSVPPIVKILVPLLILVGAGVFFVPRIGAGISRWQASARANRESGPDARTPQVLPVDEQILEERLYEGDRLTVSLNGRVFPVTIAEISDVLVLEWESGSQRIALGEEHYLDVDGDEVTDVRVALRDIDMENEEGGVFLMSQLMDAEERTAVAGTVSGDTLEVKGELSEASVILEEARPQPFRLDATFRGYCLIRYRSDNRDWAQEYFREGDQFRLEVNRSVQLGISNAGSLTAKIGGQELDLGSDGKVTVKVIRWERNEESGRYQLTSRELY